MQWYLHPSGAEFGAWEPADIVPHIGNVSLPVAEPSAALTVGACTLYPINDPGADLLPYEIVTGRTVDLMNGFANIHYTKGNKDLDVYKAERIAEVKAKRWEAETGGIVVGGAPIATTRESQAMINGAYQQAQRNIDVPGYEIDYDAGDAFVTLDCPTMIAIGEAVADHVQAVFSNSRILIEQQIMQAADHAAVCAVDVNAGWT